MWALLVLSPSMQIRDIPQPIYAPAFAGCQREIICGLLEQRDVVMSQVYSRQYGPMQVGATIFTPDWVEYAFGSTQWSVKKSTLADHECMVLTLQSITRHDEKRNHEYWASDNLVWWVGMDGKILRQWEVRSMPDGILVADALYGADSITVTVGDPTQLNAKSREYFPTSMEKLNDQFKPMIDDKKVLLQEKDYDVFNPFEGTFEHHKAKIDGLFAGTYMNIKFKGRVASIIHPKYTERSYISDERELIRSDLAPYRYLLLMTAPESKKDGHWEIRNLSEAPKRNLPRPTDISHLPPR